MIGGQMKAQMQLVLQTTQEENLDENLDQSMSHSHNLNAEHQGYECQAGQYVCLHHDEYPGAGLHLPKEGTKEKTELDLVDRVKEHMSKMPATMEKRVVMLDLQREEHLRAAPGGRYWLDRLSAGPKLGWQEAKLKLICQSPYNVVSPLLSLSVAAVFLM